MQRMGNVLQVGMEGFLSRPFECGDNVASKKSSSVKVNGEVADSNSSLKEGTIF